EPTSRPSRDESASRSSMEETASLPPATRPRRRAVDPWWLRPLPESVRRQRQPFLARLEQQVQEARAPRFWIFAGKSDARAFLDTMAGAVEKLNAEPVTTSGPTRRDLLAQLAFFVRAEYPRLRSRLTAENRAALAALIGKIDGRGAALSAFHNSLTDEV